MNTHILEFCEGYFSAKVNPEYAVLLNGPWGCGKTFFVENLEQYMISKKVLEKNDILNISIFGVTNIDELEDRIFEALHPIRSSKGYKFVGMIAKKSIEKYSNLELEEFGWKELKPEDLKKRILIIDDIERSELSPTKLLGYLSTHIIDEGIRIILICNEAEYNLKFENEIHSYERISEKVIGYKFEVKPEYDIAIANFCSEFNLNKYVNKSCDTICNVIKKLGTKNLRVIRRGIQSFIYNICDKLPEEVQDEDYLEQLLEGYLVVFIQYNVGEIEKNQVEESIAAYYNHGLSLKEYKANIKKEDKNIWDLILHKEVPLQQYLGRIICNSDINRDELYKKMKAEVDSMKGENISSLYYLLNNWYSMDSSTFKQYIDKVIEEFKIGKYIYPYDILNFVDIMITYKELEMIPYSAEDVIDLANELISSKANEIFSNTLNYYGSEIYSGFKLKNIHNKDFQNFKNKVDRINKDNLIKFIKEELSMYIDNLETKYNEFFDHIYLVNGSGRYREYPILSYMDIERLFSKLIKLDTKYQDNFLYALNDRYEIRYSEGTFNNIYYDDYDNVCKLYSLYLNKYNTESKLFNPSLVGIKFIIDELEKLKDYMKVQIKKNKNSEGEDI